MSVSEQVEISTARCPNCSKAARFRTEHRGRKGKCKGCGEPMRLVPVSDEMPAKAEPLPKAVPQPQSEPEDPITPETVEPGLGHTSKASVSYVHPHWSESIYQTMVAGFLMTVGMTIALAWLACFFGAVASLLEYFGSGKRFNDEYAPGATANAIEQIVPMMRFFLLAIIIYPLSIMFRSVSKRLPNPK